MAHFLQRIWNHGRTIRTTVSPLSRLFSSDALVEVKPGEIGMVSGIPQEHHRRRMARNRPQSSLFKEPSRQLHPFASPLFTRDGCYRRDFRKLINTDCQANKSVEIHDEADSLKPADDVSAVKHIATSNLKTSIRHDLAMIFTCKVCETRSMKTASRESYEKGVVVARCGGCNNLHLIADRLGWFGEPGSIEDFLAARGEEVKKGSTDTLNLTLEDLAGHHPTRAASPRISGLKMAHSLQRIWNHGRTMRTTVSPLSRLFSSDALVEVKPGEIGMVSGIPEEHLRRRVGKPINGLDIHWGPIC